MVEIRLIDSEETIMVRHEVLWPDKELDYVRIENDKEGYHYGLFVNKILVSVISVFIEENEAQFRKFATLVEYQGKGYGSQLFEYMLKEIEERNVNRIWCNARTDANGFYERYDFKRMSDKIFYKGEKSYTIMEKLNKPNT
jgi:ribosomal protein S18 acetylase RimI-like enzyme